MVSVAITTVAPPTAMKLIWLVPTLPLAGAFVNLLIGKRLGKYAGWLAAASGLS